MRGSFKVECSELGMADCGCFTKEDLMEVDNGFLMQRPKLKEELCFKCKEYLTDERIDKMEKEYKLGNCPRCQKTDLVIAYNKIICKSCYNWTWLEDARNSSWLKEPKGEDKWQKTNF